jgi:hypothetical protein
VLGQQLAAVVGAIAALCLGLVWLLPASAPGDNE